MAPITTFLQRKIEIAIADENEIFAKESNMEPVAATEANGNTTKRTVKAIKLWKREIPS